MSFRFTCNLFPGNHHFKFFGIEVRDKVGANFKKLDLFQIFLRVHFTEIKRDITCIYKPEAIFGFIAKSFWDNKYNLNAMLD